MKSITAKEARFVTKNADKYRDQKIQQYVYDAIVEAASDGAVSVGVSAAKVPETFKTKLETLGYRVEYKAQEAKISWSEQ